MLMMKEIQNWKHE